MGKTELSKEINIVLCAHFDLARALEEQPLLEEVGKKLALKATRIFLVINKEFSRYYQNLEFKPILWEVDLSLDQGLLSGHRVAVEHASTINIDEYYSLNSDVWSALMGVSLKSPVRIGLSSTLKKNFYTESAEEVESESFCITWQKLIEKNMEGPLSPVARPIKLSSVPMKDVSTPYVVAALPWLGNLQDYSIEIDEKKWVKLIGDLEEEQIIFLGPVKGAEKWHRVAREIGEVKKVKNLIGFTSPHEYLAIIVQSMGVLSPDPILANLCHVLSTPCGTFGKDPIPTTPYYHSTSFFESSQGDPLSFVDKFYRKIDEIKFSGRG